MISEEQIKKEAAEELKERAVHKKLGLSSRQVRDYRLRLKEGTLDVKMMLDVLNRAGRLMLKKAGDQLPDNGSDKH